MSIPEEIVRRENRKERLAEARKIIEERYAEVHRQKVDEYAEKKKVRDEQRKQGKNPRGREPEPPSENPPEGSQYNFTDGQSRINKAGSSGHVE